MFGLPSSGGDASPRIGGAVVRARAVLLEAPVAVARALGVEERLDLGDGHGVVVEEVGVAHDVAGLEGAPGGRRARGRRRAHDGDDGREERDTRPRTAVARNRFTAAVTGWSPSSGAEDPAVRRGLVRDDDRCGPGGEVAQREDEVPARGAGDVGRARARASGPPSAPAVTLTVQMPPSS